NQHSVCRTEGRADESFQAFLIIRADLPVRVKLCAGKSAVEGIESVQTAVGIHHCSVVFGPLYWVMTRLGNNVKTQGDLEAVRRIELLIKQVEECGGRKNVTSVRQFPAPHRRPECVALEGQIVQRLARHLDDIQGL